jgi:hypothetical protein
MKRVIPNDFDHRIIKSIFNVAKIKSRTEKDYIKALEHLEDGFEKYLIDVLDKLEVRATVKTNKYSLPFKDELVITIRERAIFSLASLSFLSVVRAFVKVVLEQDIYNLRFYILTDFVIVKEEGIGAVDIIYRVRYYRNNK